MGQRPDWLTDSLFRVLKELRRKLRHCQQHYRCKLRHMLDQSTCQQKFYCNYLQEHYTVMPQLPDQRCLSLYLTPTAISINPGSSFILVSIALPITC